MAISVEVEGGCQGHSDGEYCYCPYPDARAVYECVNRKCRAVALRINALSDRHSIGRWLTEHYEEEVPLSTNTKSRK